MKKNYILILLFIFSACLNAQTLSPWVIASTGAFSSNANNSLSYTVGEMTMIQTFTGPGAILTQGFQQPNDLTTGLLDIGANAAGELIVYPNPAMDRFWYVFEFTSTGEVSFVLTNVLGQRVADVFHADYDGGRVSEAAQVSALAAGTYFLTATFIDRYTHVASVVTRKLEIIR